MMNWLNDEPLNRANRLNSLRVQAAIPQPPQFSFRAVQSAMWVLECEESYIQGTAFDLEPFGVITNHHVIQNTKSMNAFRALSPNEKYPIKVLQSNATIDLAILNLEDAPRPQPLQLDRTEVAYMAHVAVCGFPNFRLGDSGVLTQVLVIGTRPKSGIQRLLTNAPVVAGMSGGPAIGASGKVIGVCVSGSRSYQSASEIEDHAIIPVDALDILTT